MAIEFDEAKYRFSLETRGFDMKRASEVFAGTTLTAEDRRKNYGEHRFFTIGYLDNKMVVLVWIPRNEDQRIISMRKANEREQAKYATRF